MKILYESKNRMFNGKSYFQVVLFTGSLKEIQILDNINDTFKTITIDELKEMIK